MKLTPLLLPLSLFTLALAAGCDDDNNPAPLPAPITPDTYVLTSGNKLVGFAASAPAAVKTVSLAVPASETLLGGDFRPGDGLFYVVTKVTADGSLKVYTANLSTGALSTAIPLLNNGNGAGGGVAGTAVRLPDATKVGVDFNPVANALRIVDSTGVNIRTTLAAGNNSFVDAPLSTGLSEAAYTNSFGTTCQTDLYYINASQLLLSAAPNGVTTNAATARLVGALGVTADDANSGFDVRTTSTGNTLVAALKVGGSYSYYEINSMTGAATSRGALGVPAGEVVVGLAANLSATAPAQQPGDTLAVIGGAAPALVSFNRPPSGSPGRQCSSVAITGIGAGETIVGGDTRPATGQLYLLTQNGAAGKLYSLAGSGAASFSANLVADGTDVTAPFMGLDGSNFGVDFNPIPDRLRVVSDSGQNLRINVETGATTTDGTLTDSLTTLARTGVSAAGYTNSLAGGSGGTLTTTLFALDSSTDRVVRIGADPGNGTAGDPGNPNSGVVTTVNPLTVGGAPLDIGAVNSFEIIGNTGLALLAAPVGGSNNLYTVNLGTGAASASGSFSGPVLALSNASAQSATVFGVTTSNKLVSFKPSAPGTVTAIGTISVPAAETVLGIDFRPTVGPRGNELWAVTSAGKLYKVDTATAAATSVSTLNSASLSFPGTGEHGVDFNPLPDRLRVVNAGRQNLRINVETGATTVDGDLSVSNVFGAGYTNSFGSTGSTALFYLAEGGGTDSLQSTSAPNDGTLTQVGAGLGVDVSAIGDLDVVGGQNGFALAALQPAAGGESSLYRISLSAGTAGSAGVIDTVGDEALRGIAIQLK